MMKKLLILLPFTLLFCIGVQSASAQNIDPARHRGKLTEKYSSYTSGPLHLSAAGIGSLKATLHKVQNIIAKYPLLQDPTGYNVVADISLLSPSEDIPWLRLPGGSIDFDFFSLYFDEDTKSIKASGETGGGLMVNVNSFQDIDYAPGTWYGDELMKVNYPVPAFFFKPESTPTKFADGVYEFIQGSRGFPIRVITNGKPLYVPFTKEQFLTYKIAYDKYQVAEQSKKYHDDLAEFQDRTTELATYRKKTNKTSTDHTFITVDSEMVASYQPIMDSEKNLLNRYTSWLKTHQQQLSALTEQEKKDAAYVVMTIDDTKGLELSKDTDPKDELWTVNPGYFDKKLPPDAVQLITIRANAASLFVSVNAIDTDLGKALMNLYHNLDYKGLKALIQ